MAALLSDYNEKQWAAALTRFTARAADNEVKRDILRLYGGTGSLNDIVLHCADTTRMRDDNTEFDRLRTELFELCR